MYDGFKVNNLIYSTYKKIAYFNKNKSCLGYCTKQRKESIAVIGRK